MIKKYKNLAFYILGFLLIINLFMGKNLILEGNTNKKDADEKEDEQKEDKQKEDEKSGDDNSNFCMKAALLGQKNNHLLEKIKSEYEDMFNNKMKTLEKKCSKAANAMHNSQLTKDPKK